MSLYGALFAGVSGLRSQSLKIGVISDNIANTNTVGYKAGSAVFQSLVTGAANSTSFSPGGVLGGNHQTVNKQGLLQSTDSPTDMAISGDGFFVVNQTADNSGQILFTRAGSFTQDATGNFRNTAGFFLQAWPLDPEGRLPGEPGNITNTISSANLTSLKTVNVQSLTAGAAAATTRISLGANLNAAQAAFAGAAGVVDMDDQDSVNANNKASDIIIPSATDKIAFNDVMTVTTGAGLSYDYTYGGFTFGRSVANSTVGNNATTHASLGGTSTISHSAVASTSVATVGGAGSHTLRVTLNGHGLVNGDVVTLAGIADFDGLTASTQLNKTFVVSNATTNTFDITFTGAGATTGVATAGTPGTQKAEVFATTNTSHTVTVRQLAHGLSEGDVVTLAGLTTATTVAGIPADELNAKFVVHVVDADHYEITTPTTAADNTAPGGGAGTITADTRPFDDGGFILDAQTASQPFLALTGITGFTSDALKFSISTAATGTTVFQYTSSAASAQNHTFNTLNNLVAAINAVNGLTARVANNQLYVGATNANDAVIFTNGQDTGDDSGTAVLSGIDWKNELGLSDIGNGVNRFSSMQGLADLVNNSTGLSATVTSPLSASSISINVQDPLDTIQFDDGNSNTGSLLAALGLVSSLNGGAYVQQTFGPQGPSYDPTDSNKNMASASTTPQFSRPITIYDSLGTAHSLNIDFLKTATNTWAVEVVVVPESDVTTGNNGQLAYGNVTFNGDGSLQFIDPALTQTLSPAWAGGALNSSITINWGTQGQPFGTPNATTIGKTDGLSQFDGGYNVNFVNQNGSQKGALSGVSIDENGFIIASFNNGQTQKLYKIPLASFTNPDSLQTNSGNVFSQTSNSGEANLKQPGTSGIGKISSASLEASNVELADQLTDMIIAQRAYQANTKVIQDAAGLLDDLNRIIQ